VTAKHILLDTTAIVNAEAGAVAGHPLDAALRQWLRQFDPHQSELAQQIGRRPAWLNKYIHGVGHATVDDVIRIVALLIGMQAPSVMDDRERRLVRGWRRLPAEAQEDVLAFLAHVSRRPRTESAGRGRRKPTGAGRRAPGTR